MANDLNQCNFIGRLGKDVETRYMTSGDAIASFSIAISSQWKDKNGEKQDSTEWVNVSVFGKLAEICGKYLEKGSQVFVSGRIKTDKYTDKEGIERYSTKIIADKIQMLGGKPKGEQSENKPLEDQSARKPSVPSFEDMDDDIPF
jgi:single-strand DNA-binding protein